MESDAAEETRAPAEDTDRPRVHPLERILHRFFDSISALREFVALIEPHIKRNVSEIMREEVANLIPLAMVLKSLGPSLPKDFEVPFSDEALKKMFDGDVNVVVTKTEESTAEARFSVSGNAAPRWTKAMERLRRNDQHSSHLFRSSLLSLTTSCEWFLSQLLTYYYERFPDAANTREKAFSLDELIALGTIQDARKYLISIRVEEVMRGPFSEWIRTFKERLKLGLGYMDGSIDDMAEIFQRRNIIVHNGSVINSIYLAKVSEKHRSGKKLDETIEVSRSYLDDAIDMLERCLSLVCAEVWKKLDPDDHSRSTYLNNLGFEHMLQERWATAQAFYTFVSNDNKTMEAAKLMARINVWQCRKWQGEDIFKEVNDFDFSAKDEKYLLAAAALKDDLASAMELARKLVGLQALRAADLREWPIFRELRRQEPWVDMVDAMET